MGQFASCEIDCRRNSDDFCFNELNVSPNLRKNRSIDGMTDSRVPKFKMDEDDASITQVQT